MIYVICLAFAFMCVFYLAFQRMKGTPRNNRPLHIAVKCAATAMAVLVALLGCLKNGTTAHWVLLAGLIACAIADGVLCVHFLAGGAIFALADVAFGSAANAGKTCGVVSLNSSIEFLRPGKVSPLTAEAFVVRDGKHILSYDVKVHDGSGALVARCMCAGFQTEIPLPE